ncbi:hypothetical protein vseg_010503 [Gypsophila vaccaria]
MATNSWRSKELTFIVLYALCFYAYIVHRSLKLSRDYYGKVWDFDLVGSLIDSMMSLMASGETSVVTCRYLQPLSEHSLL